MYSNTQLLAHIENHEQRIVIALVCVFVVVAIGFSTAPIFEGLDETAHYRFVHEFVATGALPDPTIAPKAQYHQAPLYYVILTPILLTISDTDFPGIAPMNRSFGHEIGSTGNDNKNLRIHSKAEAFPYSGSPTALAAHLMRLVSIVFGAGTIVTTYFLTHLVWPARPLLRLMSVAFLAFWPQFIFLSSLISNDNLVIFLATLSLYLVTRQVINGPTVRGTVILGVVLGACLLSKSNGAFLIFPVGAAFILDKRAWKYIPVTLGITAAISGWWYVRNMILYNDLAGMSLALRAWQGDPIPPSMWLIALLTRSPFVYQTFWARFGNTSVPVSQPIYVFFDVVTVVTLASFGVAVFRSVKTWRASPPSTSKRLVLIVFAVFQLAWLASVVYGLILAWILNQGRYLFPGAAIWAMMFAIALDTLFPSRVKAVGFGLVGLALATVVIVSLFAYFIPAYKPLEAIDSSHTLVSYRYEDAAELIGVEPTQIEARQGETLAITLYWRAIQPTKDRLTVYLHTVDADIIKRDSLPGTGNLLSTEWLPDQRWAERFIIKLADDAPPGTYQIIAGLYNPASGQTFPAINSQGETVLPVIGEITVKSSDPPAGN